MDDSDEIPCAFLFQCASRGLDYSRMEGVFILPSVVAFSIAFLG